MGAAGLDDVFVFRFQRFKRKDHPVHSRQQAVLKGDHGRDPHGGGKGVIGGLRHVYVVVWMQKCSAGQLVAAIGNDLVHVHVRLGPGAGLKDHQRKMLRQRAVHDLLCGCTNGSALLLRHLFRHQFSIRQCASFFDKG